MSDPSTYTFLLVTADNAETLVHNLRQIGDVEISPELAVLGIGDDTTRGTWFEIQLAGETLMRLRVVREP